MGIALSATVRLFSPLSIALVQWISRSPSVVAAARQRMALPPKPQKQAPCTPRSARPAELQTPPSQCKPLRRPLRIVRIVDTGHPPASAGRMTISGSMADVCAELDRLVMAESTRH